MLIMLKYSKSSKAGHNINWTRPTGNFFRAYLGLFLDLGRWNECTYFYIIILELLYKSLYRNSVSGRCLKGVVYSVYIVRLILYVFLVKKVCTSIL